MELTQLEKYEVLKVDLDIIPPDDWLEEWIITRRQILLNYVRSVVKVRVHPSKHGLHIWLHLDKPVDYDLLMKLQFLCGDDSHRVYYGMQRRGFKKFRGMFNILFNRKWQLKKAE